MCQMCVTDAGTTQYNFITFIIIIIIIIIIIFNNAKVNPFVIILSYHSDKPVESESCS